MLRNGSVLLLCMLFGLSATSVALAAMSKDQQLMLLDKANNMFEQAVASQDAQAMQGYYQQAINAYEQLIAGGVHNARLYYNLGNAYFRANDLGRAILQYRRGLQLEPGNRRLQANLHFALSRRMDQIEVKGITRQSLVARLLFWRDDLSLRTQVTIALIAFWLIWGCAFAHWFRPHSSLLGCLAINAFVFVLFAASTLLVHMQNATVRHGVIVAQEASVRKGNGNSYALQFPRPLHPGAEFEVVENRPPWLYVRLDNGATGWIRQDRAELW